MATSYGYQGLNQNFNNNDSGTLQSQIDKLNLKTLSVRVKDIILDDTNPKFLKYGGWNGVGTIEYEIVNNISKDVKNKGIAKPLIPYLKSYPLVNEIVLIFLLPDSQIGQETGSESYYYLNPISIWNHPHHNAYPNLLENNNLPDSQRKDYRDIEGGNVRRVTDGSTEINLNSPASVSKTFQERANIHPILAFAGDNILEGRFGNSIRLGSTAKSQSRDYTNNWSKVGNEGDPILILRNGQSPDVSPFGWQPLIENISKDLSSIYLTSTQQIPLRAAEESYSALSNNPPLLVREYSKSQIILNSSRLVFNSFEDSTIISGQKSVSISSEGDVGVTAKKNFNVIAESVNLGGPGSDESVILGRKFMDRFEVLLEGLRQLSNALSETDAIDDEDITNTAQNLEEICEDIKKDLPSNTNINGKLLSNRVKLS